MPHEKAEKTLDDIARFEPTDTARHIYNGIILSIPSITFTRRLKRKKVVEKLSKKGKENRTAALTKSIIALPTDLSGRQQEAYLKARKGTILSRASWSMGNLQHIYTEWDPQSRDDVTDILGNISLSPHSVETLCATLRDVSAGLDEYQRHRSLHIAQEVFRSYGSSLKNMSFGSNTQHRIKDIKDVAQGNTDLEVLKRALHIYQQVPKSGAEHPYQDIVAFLAEFDKEVSPDKQTALEQALEILPESLQRTDYLALAWKGIIDTSKKQMAHWFEGLDALKEDAPWKSAASLRYFKMHTRTHLDPRDVLAQAEDILNLPDNIQSAMSIILPTWGLDPDSAIYSLDMLKTITRAVEDIGISVPNDKKYEGGIAGTRNDVFREYAKLSTSKRAMAARALQIYVDALTPKLTDTKDKGDKRLKKISAFIESFSIALPKIVNLPESSIEQIIHQAAKEYDSSGEFTLPGLLSPTRRTHHSGTASIDNLCGTLSQYGNMIAGKDHDITVLPGESVMFDYDHKRRNSVIRMPRSQMHFLSEEQNTELYQAMTAWLAGHLRYGTLRNDHGFVDINAIAQTHAFPELFRTIIDTLEGTRIRHHLSADYPGIRSKMERLEDYLIRTVLPNMKSCNELSEFFHEAVRNKTKRWPQVEKVAAKGSTFKTTLAEAEKVYKAIEPHYREEKQTFKQQVFSISDSQESIREAYEKKIMPPDSNGHGKVFWYPEYDATTGQEIKNAVQVKESEAQALDFTPELITSVPPSVLRHLTQEFEMLEEEEVETIRRQTHGHISMPDYIKWHIERLQGRQSSRPAIFYQRRHSLRSVATAIAVEHSGSAKRFVKGEMGMVSDYIKLITDTLARCMGLLGDDIGIFAYNGRSADNVNAMVVNPFGRHYDDAAQRKLFCLEPQHNNRDGAMLRHVGAQHLSNTDRQTRILLNITDGVPFDKGYEGDYAHTDIIEACKSLERRGITPLRVVVDPTLSREQIKDLRDDYTVHIGNFSDAVNIIPHLYYSMTR